MEERSGVRARGSEWNALDNLAGSRAIADKNGRGARDDIDGGPRVTTTNAPFMDPIHPLIRPGPVCLPTVRSRPIESPWSMA
jgi:hypothetical protein